MIIFIIFLITIFIWNNSKGNKEKFELSFDMDYIYAISRDGDIICRMGKGIWSDKIADLSEKDKRFSHVGIIRKSNNQITVINADGTATQKRGFVNEDSLESFLKDSSMIGIFRTNDVDGHLISNVAFEYIGVPFDWNFDLDDVHELYCTELIYVVLKDLESKIQLKKIFKNEIDKIIVPLDAISNSIDFTEIYIN